MNAMVTSRSYQLPSDLQRWGWMMQQMKSGPRKHPGGWWQFIFWRWKGLAEGDDALAHDDLSLRVKVRQATIEETLAGAIDEMRAASAKLVRSDEYDIRFAEFSRSASPYLWTVTRPD
jgi:hypothetical protein